MSKIDEAKLIEELNKIIIRFQNASYTSLRVKSHADEGYLLTKNLIEVLEKGTVKSQSNEDCPNFFPDPYADMLNVLPLPDKYEVYPIKFLGTDNFKQIADIIQKLGGAYVKGDKAAGVKAHFTIPKEKGI